MTEDGGTVGRSALGREQREELELPGLKDDKEENNQVLTQKVLYHFSTFIDQTLLFCRSSVSCKVMLWYMLSTCSEIYTSRFCHIFQAACEAATR